MVVLARTVAVDDAIIAVAVLIYVGSYNESAVEDLEDAVSLEEVKPRNWT